MPHPMKKKKKDWFDSHVEIIGLDDKINKAVKDKIKAEFYAEANEKKQI